MRRFSIVERKRRFHGFRARKLACIVDVAVNVRRRAHIGMPQPILNRLHRHVVGEQNGRAGMPQIVKTDIFQTVVSKNKLEVPRDVLRRQDLAQGIHADIVEILFAVRFPHRPPHLFLL